MEWGDIMEGEIMEGDIMEGDIMAGESHKAVDAVHGTSPTTMVIFITENRVCYPHAAALLSLPPVGAVPGGPVNKSPRHAGRLGSSYFWNKGGKPAETCAVLHPRVARHIALRQVVEELLQVMSIAPDVLVESDLVSGGVFPRAAARGPVPGVTHL